MLGDGQAAAAAEAWLGIDKARNMSQAMSLLEVDG
jgi:hypothetical protein